MTRKPLTSLRRGGRLSLRSTISVTGLRISVEPSTLREFSLPREDLGSIYENDWRTLGKYLHKEDILPSIRVARSRGLPEGWEEWCRNRASSPTDRLFSVAHRDLAHDDL